MSSSPPSASTTKRSATTSGVSVLYNLKAIPASELVFSKRTLVDIHADKSVLEALQVMHSNEIHALPVFGDSTHWIAAGGGTNAADAQRLLTSKMYLGIISIADVLAWFLMNSRLTEQAFLPTLSAVHVVQLVGLSKESKSLWIAPANATLLSIMEPLTKGLHRWLIPWASSSSQVSLCTQSDVLRYLYNEAFPMPVCAVAKLMSLTQGFSKDTQIRDLVHWMIERDAHVVPIVHSSENGLAGVFHVYFFRSLSHLRLIITSETVQTSLQPAVTVDLTLSFANLVKLMVTHRVHEVWVVKRDQTLKGIVTLTDVLKAWFEMFINETNKK